MNHANVSVKIYFIYTKSIRIFGFLSLSLFFNTRITIFTLTSDNFLAAFLCFVLDIV